MATKRAKKGGAGAARHVALLRGINVGGKNKLPMQKLVGIFEEAGCDDVRTYIQSGNVVFSAKAAVLRQLPGAIERGIASHFGFEVPVVLRSATELRAAVTRNPFLEAGADPAHLHLTFLRDAPARASARALDPERSPGDAFRLVGRELYLHLPNGVARTKLTSAYLDKTLGTVTTVRNWRTVQKLLELTKQ